MPVCRKCLRVLSIFILTTVPVAVAASGGSPAAQASTPAGHPELLVSTQWLADHLSDPKVVIVQVGKKEDDYRKAHIPGARFLAVDKIADVETPPRTELLPPEELKHNLEAIGLGDDTRIVIYTTDYDPIAARLFFTLDYLGHGDHAALLDGSFDRWTKENRPTSNEIPAPRKGSLSLHLHPEVVAKLDSVAKLTEGDGGAARVTIIDSRPQQRYRDGHLPGAATLYWETTQSDHLLRPAAELRRMFADAGAGSGSKVVSYCEVGNQASYVYWVARYLGLDAAMYDGSYTEWSAAGKPVVRGDARR